jgi:hypothetical protein
VQRRVRVNQLATVYGNERFTMMTIAGIAKRFSRWRAGARLSVRLSAL